MELWNVPDVCFTTYAEGIMEVCLFTTYKFVFWTLTLLPLLKYVFIVLRADDNGEGERQKERHSLSDKSNLLVARCLNLVNVKFCLRWNFCVVLTHLSSCQSQPLSKQTSS